MAIIRSWGVTIQTQGPHLRLEPVLVNAGFSESQCVPTAYWKGEVGVVGT